MKRILAAPTLNETGGGIAVASRLVWMAMEATWPGDCRALTLTADGRARPSTLDKVRFGTALAAWQTLGAARWIVFSHLGLTRANRALPAALRVPYAVFLYGVECWHRLEAADQHMLAGARLRLAISEFTAARVMAANPEIGDVVVCPLALPSIPLHTPPAGGTSAADRAIVLVVGRMDATERYKGHDQLIDAWKHVLDRVPQAQLVIVGDGGDRARLEARAAGYGDRVRFTGFISRESRDAWYAQAAVFALPSRGEGFGLVYLEAMAHGVPCIGSIHDAAREVIADDETGVLVDPEDSGALASAIVRLLEDRDRSVRLGAAGLHRLRTEFTFDHFKQRVVRLFDEAFEGGARSAVLGSTAP